MKKIINFASDLTMNFTPEISDVQLSLLISATALTLIAAIAILFRIVPLRRHFKHCNNVADDRSDLPRAAVIIFARDDYDSLAELLPQVLNQRYEPGFEVIVVNDGDSIEVREVVEQFMFAHKNLYFTAAPDGARNLSRKKLALTLGIKAAKSPVVVHTTSSARIPSADWLKNIMKHFRPEGNVDVVIGYACAPAYDDTSFGARARSFDSVAHDLGWVAPAAAGKAWSGTESNLAYRRDIFFENKGFSRHLNLRDGDDDIFVSEISHRGNTVLELCNDAFVEVPGANSSRALNDRIGRRRFTKRFISSRPRLAGMISAAAYSLAPIPWVASLFFGTFDLLGWIYFGIIALLWYSVGLLWNPAVRILRGRKLLLSTPMLAFTRPVRILHRTAASMLRKNKRYTWE